MTSRHERIPFGRPVPPTDPLQLANDLRVQVRSRLERVRGALSDEEFSALVDDIVAMKVRWGVGRD